MMENSKVKNKALTTLNNKLLETKNVTGIIAPYFLSPLSEISNPEKNSQFKLVKDSGSDRVSDLLMHNTIPVTLFDNLLIFRDTNKEVELQGDLLKIITNKCYNVDLANLQDKKLIYCFANEMYFDLKAPGNKSTRDRSLMRLLKTPGLMISASGISNTIFLSSNPNERFNQLKLLLQEKQAGINSVITNEEIVAINDKLLEYKCITPTQHNFFFKFVLL